METRNCMINLNIVSAKRAIYFSSIWKDNFIFSLPFWKCKARSSSKSKYSWVLFQGKGTIRTFFLSGKDGFTKPLPDIRLAAGLEAHTFK